MTDTQVQPVQSQVQDEVLPVMDIPADVRLYLETILDEADLLILTEEEKEQTLQNMYRQLNLFLLERMIEELPEDKLEAFQKLDEEGADLPKLEEFIKASLPNAQQTFEKLFDEFANLFLETIAIEEARLDAVEQDSSTTPKSFLEKLAIGEHVAADQ